MQRVVLEDAVIFEAETGLQVTREHCSVCGPHWPHIIERGAIRTLCPGRGQEGLVILRKVGNENKYLIIDWDKESKRLGLKALGAKAALILRLKAWRMIFLGTRTRCGNEAPHYPHIVNTYDHPEYDELEVYCPGKSGRYEIYECKWQYDSLSPEESLFYVIE